MNSNKTKSDLTTTSSLVVFGFKNEFQSRFWLNKKITNLVVTVEGVEGHGALAHVNEALRDANHEQVVGVLGVILGQLK